MKKNYLLSISFVLINVCVCAQNGLSDEKESVKKVIVQLFDAMKAGDSTRLAAVFHPEARLQTASLHPKTGQTTLETDDISAFITQVGMPHPEIYDERITAYEISVDGPLATAWTPYRFYVGEKFSHCGVNAFQLFKSKDGWKIIQITDTRRRESCEESKN